MKNANKQLQEEVITFHKVIIGFAYHWVHNGYDRDKLNDVIKTVRNQLDFYGFVRLYQIVEITGKPINYYLKI